MQRLIMAAALTMALGVGMLAGGMLTHYAGAQTPGVPGTLTNNTPNYATPGYQYPGIALIQNRWQIVVIPTGTPNGAITLLLDSQTGDSYALRPEQILPGPGYTWVRLVRR
ncbi:MAG TPA: hypothetical protein VGM23_16355 [Armatimonadota bacterium]|jgi:hypothetical protein